MSYELYLGVWPQNVSKLAKYAVRFIDNEWKVTVSCDMGDGLRYLAVEGGEHDLADRVNQAKLSLQGEPGGAFYLNEYRHVLVPVKEGSSSVYYGIGRHDGDLMFEFEGDRLSTKPEAPDGRPLSPGDTWLGPRPGIPYVLAAGAGDIYYERPALTSEAPPRVRPNMIQRVQLSRVLGDATRLVRAVAPIANIRGHQGGRFYVNENGAIFSPVDRGDGDGLRYIYCGLVNFENWFPSP
jgi:hypothetical protein